MLSSLNSSYMRAPKLRRAALITLSSIKNWTLQFERILKRSTKTHELFKMSIDESRGMCIFERRVPDNVCDSPTKVDLQYTLLLIQKLGIMCYPAELIMSIMFR